MSFFTIIIPTRNRPDLIIECVKSVLDQNFQEFEIVVSDNSDQEETKHKLQSFMDKIRYVRPEKVLSMPDHWEFASKHAQNEYVLFLTDRSILKQGALKKVCEELKKNNVSERVNVVSWMWDLYDDETGMLLPVRVENLGAAENFLSEVILSDFLTKQGFFSYRFPRALNGCYLREYGETIRLRFGRIFRPLAPDNSFAFMSLLDLKSILHIGEALFISRGLKVSSGGKHYFADATAYCKTLGPESQFRHSPILSQTVESGHYEDYLRCRALKGYSLKMETENWVVFYLKCYWEIFSKKISAYKGIKDLVAEFDNDWNQALQKEPEEIRDRVLHKISRDKMGHIKRYFQALNWPRTIVRYIRFIKAKIFGETYSSVLVAAGFTKNTKGL